MEMVLFESFCHFPPKHDFQFRKSCCVFTIKKKNKKQIVEIKFPLHGVRVRYCAHSFVHFLLANTK